MGYPLNESLASLVKLFYDLFPKVLEISLTASIVILLVICVRIFLKGAPKIFSYALWGIVLLRLLVPISIESPVSVVPERAELSNMVEVNEVLPPIEWEDVSRNREIRENTPPGEPLVQTGTSVDPQGYLTLLWLAGMIFLFVRSLLSYLGLHETVKVAIPLRKGIYIADHIDSPFIMGFVRPKIYLPGTLTEQEQRYIIYHEQHHIRRGDHIFKALGFLTLIVHWFNPLVWLAFILASRDMEMSCDEAVIRKLGENIRAEYSATLLNLATGHRVIAGTPLAFGEGDPKGRIRNLANWKKPKVWIILACVVLCLLLTVCLLTDPEQKTESVITEPESYFALNETHIIDYGNISETNSELPLQTIAVAFKRTSGPRDFVIDVQYRKKADEAWTSLEFKELNLPQDVCTFEVPAPCEYQIIAVATTGKNGYAYFEIADYGVRTLQDVAESTSVEKIALKNLHNGMTTDIESAGSIAKICDYLRTLYGVNDGSGKGYYEGSYELTIYLNDSSEFYAIAFGDSDCFYLGKGADGYPVRYQLLGTKIENVISNLSTFDSSGFVWDYLGQTEENVETTAAAYQDWPVTIEAHDVTPESLVLTYHNAGDEPFYRLPGYTISRWEDGHWVDLDVGKTWYETTEPVYFEHQSKPENGMFIQWDGIGTLSDGQYLIGQEFCTEADLSRGERFTVHTSFTVSGEANTVKPLEELPEIYSAEQAMIDGCLVNQDSEVLADTLPQLQAFIEASNRGESAFLRIVNWYYGDDSYYTAQDLTFDGSEYTLEWIENGRHQSRTYRYLMHFTGEKEQENMAYDAYENYVLVNDSSVTWEQIFEGMISSRFGDGIDHWTIASDYIYYSRHPNLPDKPNYAVLEFMDEGLVTVLNGERLEKLTALFENGEYLGYEPKTHSIDGTLKLMFNTNEVDFDTNEMGDFIIELDPDQDICRINGEYVFYGAFEEPDYILKLWEYLGITQWSDIVYQVYPNALRP